MKPITHVLKLGGSLLDLPDLPDRFADLRASLAGERLTLVVGGGDAADIVRGFDKRYSLGEEAGHWLAVRAMQLNAHLVATLLPRCRRVSDADGCQAAWETGDLALVDPLEWLELEHAQGVRLPHRWTFTSDSIAAHVAVRLEASRLTLLKSASPAAGSDVGRAMELGIVDEDFPWASRDIPRIDLVDLRQHPLKFIALRGF